MKYFLKIIVPLLLVVALIASAAWYLLIYDPDFTRDVLLDQARRFENQGNHSLASTFYQLAYRQSSENEDVAIELADRYKAMGNYTKAEYTLSNAISDGGTAKLYIALCKTYVEQDKLLDAVTMLDNIADPAIKEQLDAMRPEKPTAAPEPGFYSQYINVELESSADALYYSTDGSYPSLSGLRYSEPVPMSIGETTIYALSVNEDGLVSPLFVTGYTVGGVIEPVVIQDVQIDAAIRDLLGFKEDQTIYTNDLWKITTFTVPEDVVALDDLSKLPYLRNLIIQNITVSNLDFLNSLVHLESLDVFSCKVNADSLSAIAALPALQRLTLSNCSLSTVAGLEGASSLYYLDLSGNTIRNINALSSMPNLQEINLQHNALTDLTALAGLKNLQKLDVSYNSIHSVSPLSACSTLGWLDISNNSVNSIAPLSGLTALIHFSANHNAISDITALSGCKEMQELDLANNSVSSLEPLKKLTKIMTLSFAYNEVTELPEWPVDCALVSIDGSYNQLETIDILGGMYNLNYVFMDYNTGIRNIDLLGDCHRLAVVNVFGTRVTDVTALTDHSIIVNYDPTFIDTLDPIEETEEAE